MTPEQIKHLHDLLDERERTFTQHQAFDNMRDLKAATHVEMKTNKPWEDRDIASSLTFSFLLTPQERGRVLDLLKDIYRARLTTINTELIGEGIQLPSDAVIIDARPDKDST